MQGQVNRYRVPSHPPPGGADHAEEEVVAVQRAVDLDEGRAHRRRGAVGFKHPGVAGEDGHAGSDGGLGEVHRGSVAVTESGKEQPGMEAIECCSPRFRVQQIFHAFRVFTRQNMNICVQRTGLLKGGGPLCYALQESPRQEFNA